MRTNQSGPEVSVRASQYGSREAPLLDKSWAVRREEPPGIFVSDFVTHSVWSSPCWVT